MLSPSKPSGDKRTTGREFGLFLKDFERSFPGFESWLRRLQQQRGAEAVDKAPQGVSGETLKELSNSAKQAVLVGWHRSLRDYSLIELGTVLDEIVAGRLPKLEPTDYPEFGLVFLRIARQWRNEKRRRDDLIAAPILAPMSSDDPSCARGFVACHRVIGECRKLQIDQCEEDRIALAVATLLDNPTGDERTRAEDRLKSHGLLDRMSEFTSAMKPGERIDLFTSVSADAGDR
jgi:hypothetical protein